MRRVPDASDPSGVDYDHPLPPDDGRRAYEPLPTAERVPRKRAEMDRWDDNGRRMEGKGRRRWKCRIGLHRFEDERHDIGPCVRAGCDKFVASRNMGSYWVHYTPPPGP